MAQTSAARSRADSRILGLVLTAICLAPRRIRLRKRLRNDFPQILQKHRTACVRHSLKRPGLIRHDPYGHIVGADAHFPRPCNDFGAVRRRTGMLLGDKRIPFTSVLLMLAFVGVAQFTGSLTAMLPT